MNRYYNKKETAKVGAHIRKLRKGAGFSLDDIAHMTGFAQSHLSAIENGSEVGLSHLIEIAKAIGVHPRDLLDIQFTIKPRFALQPNRVNRKQLTLRISKLCDDTDFFARPKFVRDVISYFAEQFDTTVSSSSMAGTLKRFAEAGKLKIIKTGRQYQYLKKIAQ